MAEGSEEIGLAFGPLEARARAMAEGRPCDRIAVRDDIRAVEIGAFGEERGTTQRLRFNVVLEVAPHAAAEGDDVDRVISYDTITDAITAELERERLDLLETLAERIADRTLADPRARRVFIRIEKLDRGTGSLGVEIVRARADAGEVPGESVAGVTPLVIYLGPEHLGGPRGTAWIAAALERQGPLVLCVAPDPPEALARSEASLRAGLLSIDRAAWRLADRAPGFAVVGSRTELDWALARRQHVIWAPAKMVLDARARPGADASDPPLLARWLAERLGASFSAAGGAATAQVLSDPADLSTLS
ncbi:dihydroneopterin aldolase [Amaricoccus sp. W119]|uniref:dihydroneopterin aldolase n=1 Tax=Amaricoccus sp. W119 TaxID=3391833 RepID=UPI0039A4F728